MSAKPPTPQAISSLLRKAGFEKAVITDNNRYHKENTAGFHIVKGAGDVRVTWWSESVLPSARTTAFVEAERAEERRMLTVYAEVIRAGGWAVEEKPSLGFLSVYAPREDTR